MTIRNGLSPLTFNINTNNAEMHECPGNICGNRSLFVNPSQDYGYFLSTTDLANVPGITITFPFPGIKGFT